MTKQGNKFITFIILYVLSGVYFFIFSESGLLERTSLLKKNQQVILKIKQLQKENNRLLNTYNDLRKNKGIETLLLDAGYISSKNEIIILQGISESLKEPGTKKTDKTFQFEINHLRIIWAVVSILILLFYYSKRMRTNES